VGVPERGVNCGRSPPLLPWGSGSYATWGSADPARCCARRCCQEMKSVDGMGLGSIRRCFCHTFAAFITGGVVG
jgi:hypothetical protein